VAADDRSFHGPRARIALAALAAALWAGVARAAAPASDAPSTAAPGRVARLADILDQARERNPMLRAARERTHALEAVPPQAAAYDDPTLSWEAWNFPESLRIDRADNNIFRLSQKLPFPGKRRLAGEVAAREADRAGFEADAVELDVVTAVKRAYYDLWESVRRREVLERERNLLERFSRVAEQKYGLSEATQGDVLKSQVELTHVVNEIVKEKLATDTARSELNALLSVAPDSDPGTPEDPPAPRVELDPDELVATALAKRPEIAERGAAIARDETAVELARKNYLPDFEVSVGRFVNYGANDGFGAMASVTLPFVNREKYDAGVAEARARVRAEESERRSLEDRLRREVRQGVLRVRTAALQHDLFLHTHIPQTEQALRAAEAGYESGETSFLDVIDTLRRIESVHLEHIAAQADFERSFADLERVVGAEIPRARAGARTRDGEHRD